MHQHEWPRCIRSARRKRRLVKTDRDKQLLRLNKRQAELWEQRNDLPSVELEQPYQRGWKRFFVLRDDVKYSPRAEFYENLLLKINTSEWHHDRSFKRKKRRKQRYYYRVKQQMLRELSERSWDNNWLKLTEQEQACFTRVETFDVKTYRTNVSYVFTEPWRYVLKVAPNMVTHVKPLDSELEQELAWIDGYIDNHWLGPRIHRLTHGKNYRWHDDFNEKPKYINKLKNIPRYSLKEAYGD